MGAGAATGRPLSPDKEDDVRSETGRRAGNTDLTTCTPSQTQVPPTASRGARAVSNACPFRQGASQPPYAGSDQFCPS